MAGNSFGVLFRITTWGESHGKAVGVTIDGCPAGIGLDEEDIQKELNRRRPGLFPGASPRREADKVEILSGIFEGKTTGTPLALVVANVDIDSGPYEEIREVFRPGQGDFTYHRKYGIRDHRGGGRASARETLSRVAAGAVAGKILAPLGIEIIGFSRAIGDVEIPEEALEQLSTERVGANYLSCPHEETAKKMEEALARAREAGDTLGGVVEIRVRGCPPGLGEPVFDKIDADFAGALMGIGSVKGVEVGSGFAASRLRGSQANDQMSAQGFISNHAGGILAGITNGEEIVLRVACKPIPSIARPQRTRDTGGREVDLTLGGRHDVCALPRIVPVCEAMVKLVLADHLLRQRALAWQ